MIIHSNFHDYYDSASSFGVDPTCHYIRNKQEILDGLLFTKVIDFLRPKNRESYLYRNNIERFDYVFYCGYLYKIAKIYIGAERIFKYVHTNEEFTKLLASDIKIYSSPDKRCVNTWGAGYWDPEIPALTPQKISDDLFFELGSPCFSLSWNRFTSGEDCTLELNACLKDFEFYKHKLASIVFQEIHGYISGILGAQHPKVLNVSDTVRLEKHGFDKKMSFRKRRRN